MKLQLRCSRRWRAASCAASPKFSPCRSTTARGNAIWSSGDFLLAEDHALIAEVVEDPHDVRGHSCGLWWESADTARARCALADFRGRSIPRRLLLVAFSGLTTCEEDRALRVLELTPVLPVLAKAMHRWREAMNPWLTVPGAPAGEPGLPPSLRPLRFVGDVPDDGLAVRHRGARPRTASARPHRRRAARRRIRAAPAAHRVAARLHQERRHSSSRC